MTIIITYKFLLLHTKIIPLVFDVSHCNVITSINIALSFSEYHYFFRLIYDRLLDPYIHQ